MTFVAVRRALNLLGAILVVATFSGCGGSSDSPSLDLNPQIFVVGADGSDLRQLTIAGMNWSPTWAPDGARLAYISARKDERAIEIVRVDGTGREALLRRPSTLVAHASLRWSPNGQTLGYVAFGEPASVTVETLGAAGARRTLVDSFRTTRIIDIGPTWSPDGRRFAYARDMKVVIVNLRGRMRRPLTNDGAPEFDPRWSPVGDSVLFTRDEGQSFTLVVGSRGRPARAVLGGLIDVHAEWSPDGRTISFAGVTFAGDRRYHLYVVDARPAARPRRIIGPVQAGRPAWSPDGRWLAYATDDGSVRTIEPSSGKQRSIAQFDRAQVLDLTWSPDGRRIAFSARERPVET